MIHNMNYMIWLVFFFAAATFLPMNRSDSENRPTGAAFLLAQLGAHAARRFGERIQGTGLTPPQAGILRLIISTPNCSQQQLARRLGVLPSRMVLLIDELEDKGLVERAPHPSDRRTHALAL